MNGPQRAGGGEQGLSVGKLAQSFNQAFTEAQSSGRKIYQVADGFKAMNWKEAAAAWIRSAGQVRRLSPAQLKQFGKAFERAGAKHVQTERIDAQAQKVASGAALRPSVKANQLFQSRVGQITPEAIAEQKLADFEVPADPEQLDREAISGALKSFVQSCLSAEDKVAGAKVLVRSEALGSLLKNLEQTIGMKGLRKLLLEQIEPRAVGQLIYYNVKCAQQEQSDPHTITVGGPQGREVHLDYQYGSSLASIAQKAEEGLGAQVAILRDDVVSGLWIPVDVTGREDIAGLEPGLLPDDFDPQAYIEDSDRIAVAVEKADIVYVLPADPSIQDAIAEFDASDMYEVD